MWEERILVEGRALLSWKLHRWQNSLPSIKGTDVRVEANEKMVTQWVAASSQDGKDGCF